MSKTKSSPTSAPSTSRPSSKSGSPSKAPASAAASAEASCGPADALAPEHEKFKPFAGRFRAEVKLWMGPGEPSVSSGVMENTLDLGGRFLRQTYCGDPSDGPFCNFEGRGFWGYNTATDKYEGFWIDTASTVMQTEIGTVDAAGKVWTMSGQVPNPQTGKPMVKKSIIKLVDRDHHSLEMFFDVEGGKPFKAMEISYTRIK